MSDAAIPLEAPEQLVVQDAKETPEQVIVEKVKESPKAPEPIATGTDKIAILKHNLPVRTVIDEYSAPAGVELAIRNVSGKTIATIIFEAVFYDEAGNIVEQVRHEEVSLDAETSRAIHIPFTPSFYDRVKSYAVQIIRTTTADFEKVQLRRHELRTLDGVEEVTGIAKNIGETKTDAAVVVTFYDPQKEIVGTKVVVLRDIEPHTIREFGLRFKPQEGDLVISYTIRIGEIEA